jgi:hypothetical protein
MFRLRDSQAPYIPQHAKYFVEGLQVKNITWIQNEPRRNKSNPHNARVWWCGRLGMCGSPRKDAVIIDFNFVGNKWILDRYVMSRRNQTCRGACEIHMKFFRTTTRRMKPSSCPAGMRYSISYCITPLLHNIRNYYSVRSLSSSHFILHTNSSLAFSQLQAEFLNFLTQEDAQYYALGYLDHKKNKHTFRFFNPDDPEMRFIAE